MFVQSTPKNMISIPEAIAKSSLPFTVTKVFLSLIHILALSLIEEASYRKELHELIRQHYLYTGSKLARTMLDDWNRYVDEFIQVVPIEYKRVLQEEQMRKLQQKIADVQRDY